LKRWASGEPVEQDQCRMVYEQALRLPWKVAMSCLVASAIGYLGGAGIVHWQANQPVAEMIKTLPAIPLVGGMMGAFCYFGTVRTLYPVVAWCSRHLIQPPVLAHVPMAAKFLTTTCVLAIAVLCLLLPASYTLGQVVTERHLQDRALTQLQLALREAGPLDPQTLELRKASVGAHGYVFAVDQDGRIVTSHPSGYTNVAQEHFSRLADRLQGLQGVWVDRVGRHRVVAFIRFADPPWTLLSVSLPTDFSAPLRHFLLLSSLIVVEVLLAVAVFGRCAVYVSSR
jgi:hypothetical protein